MKKNLVKLACILSVTALSACGVAQNDSKTSTSLVVDSEITANAFHLSGNIIEVKNEAASQGLGLWTKITLEYLVPCTESFSSFSYKIANKNGKSQIIAAAIATARVQSDETGFVCQAFSHHREEIILPGLWSKEGIELVNLKGTSKGLTDKVVGLRALSQAKVVSTRPLCPEGVVCVTDGTVITLSSSMICVNEIGPVAYQTAQSNVGGAAKLNLTLSAFEVLNKGHDRVRCANIPRTFEISLPMIFVEKENISLDLLK